MKSLGWRLLVMHMLSKYISWFMELFKYKIHKNSLKENIDWENIHTGAMYSSVPTNEFDCVLGSATKTGWIRSLDLLLLVSDECLITCVFWI